VAICRGCCVLESEWVTRRHQRGEPAADPRRTSPRGGKRTQVIDLDHGERNLRAELRMGS